MMRRALLSLALVASCAAHPETKPISTPLPTLAEARAAIATKPPPPDRRVLRAVSEVHHLLTGEPRKETTAVASTDGFAIQHGARRVGTMPADAPYPIAKKLLVGWIAEIGAPLALAATPVASQDEPPLDREAFALLADVQSTWSATPTRKGLHDATRALVGLALSTPDDLGLGDDLLARALAACIVDQELHASTAVREEALIAFLLGYEDAARAVGAALPATDPVRALVSEDDAALGAATGVLAGLLQLSRATAKGVFAAAPTIRRRALASHALDPSVLGARLRAEDDTDGHVAEALLTTAVLDAADDTGAATGAKANADLDALRRTPDPDVGRVRPIVYGWLGLQREDALIRFEHDLARVGDHDLGPFLDRSLRRTILSARATTALRWIGLRRDDATFGAEVGTGAGALASALRAWHAPIAAARAHVLDAPPPFATPLDALGPIAAIDRLDRIEQENGGDAASRREAKWILDRLDARPPHRPLLAMLSQRLGVGPRPDRPPTIESRIVPSPELELLSLLKAGKFAEAEQIARARAAKLAPIEGASLIAETQWRAGNHEGAARTLTQLGRVERRAAWPIGLAFVSVFPGGPDAGPSRRAAKALLDASVHASVLREIAQIALGARNVEVGQMLYDVVVASLPPSIERESVRLEMTALLARAKGETPPLAPTSPFSAWTAPLAYELGLAVAPMRIAGPSETEELTALLSIATRDALRTPSRSRELAREILVSGRTRFAVLGRYLLGLESEDTVRKLPTTPRERCEAAYYLAVAADARGDAEATTAWLQLALDEGSPAIAEWRWARSRSYAFPP